MLEKNNRQIVVARNNIDFVRHINLRVLLSAREKQI